MKNHTAPRRAVEKSVGKMAFLFSSVFFQSLRPFCHDNGCCPAAGLSRNYVFDVSLLVGEKGRDSVQSGLEKPKKPEEILGFVGWVFFGGVSAGRLRTVAVVVWTFIAGAPHHFTPAENGGCCTARKATHSFSP